MRVEDGLLFLDKLHIYFRVVVNHEMSPMAVDGHERDFCFVEIDRRVDSEEFHEPLSCLFIHVEFCETMLNGDEPIGGFADTKTSRVCRGSCQRSCSPRGSFFPLYPPPPPPTTSKPPGKT